MSETDLLGPLRRFAQCCNSCIGPRPGSNFLPLLYLGTPDDSVTVDGEDLELLFRAGLLHAEPHNQTDVVQNTEEFGGIEVDHRWSLSAAGRTALAKSQEQGRE